MNPAGNAASDQPPGDFETAMRRLDRIVQELESGQISLDKAIQLFEEGSKLGQQCAVMLEKAEAHIDKLLQASDGTAVREPMQPS